MPRKFLVIIMSLLLATTVASIFLGVKDISAVEVLAALFKLETAKPLVISVVHKRILRTCFALMCGAALGVSGVLMQAVTRNPLADPSILGINSGASFFVVSGIAFLQITTAGEYIVLALLGAFVAAGLVFGVVALGHKMSPLTLILSGTAVSIVFSSLVTTVVLVKQDALDSYRFWQVGSLGGASWHGLMLFLPILLLGILGLFCVPQP
nr:iron ABC transporter permease [Ligilactobacillus salitolerans]